MDKSRRPKTSEMPGLLCKADRAAPHNARLLGSEQFDPKVERWFATVGAAFPRCRSSMIPMLQSAQTGLGYLPRNAMYAIARHLVVSPALVEGVASFYAQFRFDKPGRHRIAVCTGTACYVRGGGKLMTEIGTELAIASGETTPDGAVSLEAVSCFGTCALAPVVVLDGKVLRQQTSESVKQVVADIFSGPSKAGSDGKGCSAAARRVSE
jgi:NADH-quinone oxidoreductase subunit E